MKKLSILIIGLIIVLLFGAWALPLWNPQIRGTADGLYGQMAFRIDTDLTGDTWLLGDTTATENLYFPPQPVEIRDIIVYHDPDVDDSCYVKIYAYDATACELAASTANLTGTAWLVQDSVSTYGSLSDTYKIITPAEGMAVLFDHAGGTPNKVTVVIEYITRHQDHLE